jgi:SAM-dependent methyltransferase
MNAFRGVRQIVRFNWAAYARAAAGVAAALVLAQFAPQWRAWLWAAAAAASFWTASSLAVSHYVYDRYPLYRFAWLAGSLERIPRRWLNLHAGLDESTSALAAALPGSTGVPLDFYDAREMTEPSIRRARGIRPPRTAHVDWRALPVAADGFDAAFLVFAAHELRRPEGRVRLFEEVRRAVRPGGELILIEHVRGWANFLAFGPGCFHFLSIQEWLRTACEAGLGLERRLALTPFVDALILRREL